MLPPTIPKQPIRPCSRCDHVHGAGATATHARCSAEQLVEQALRLEPEREGMTVSAIRARHAVIAGEQAGNPDLDRFLTRAEMGGAVHVTLEEERLDEVLEAADHEHATVEVEVERGVRASPRRRALPRRSSRCRFELCDVGAAHVGAAAHEQLVGREPRQHLAAVRRDERPPPRCAPPTCRRVAGQYVSSAKTIPSSISTGSWKEWRREIIGAS